MYYSCLYDYNMSQNPILKRKALTLAEDLWLPLGPVDHGRVQLLCCMSQRALCLSPKLAPKSFPHAADAAAKSTMGAQLSVASGMATLLMLGLRIARALL